MRHKRSTSSLIGLFLAFIILIDISCFLKPAESAYLQGDTDMRTDEEEAVDEYVPPVIILPPPPPVYPPPKYGNFHEFVDSLRVTGRPVKYGKLKIYPLTSSNDRYRSDMITLDDAYRRGEIRIGEYDDGVVSNVVITSYSGRYIFIMAGEILSGGKQTRTTLKDVLIPPYAKNVVVDVYCIEEGRWAGDKRVFIPEEPMLDSDIRKKVMREEGQSEIWSGVREYERKSERYSDTHNLLDVYKHSRDNSRIMREAVSIKGSLPYNSVGMVVVKHGRIIGIEAFSSRDIFSKQFCRLINSYYYADVPRSYFRSVDADDVRSFLNDLLDARLVRDTGYPGAGILYDASRGGFYGSVLDFGGVLHLSMIN